MEPCILKDYTVLKFRNLWASGFNRPAFCDSLKAAEKATKRLLGMFTNQRDVLHTRLQLTCVQA